MAEHNDGMKVSNLYIAQIKQKHGIIERENYNKPKSEKGGQPECPKEKEIAIEEALKYFQMIPSESQAKLGLSDGENPTNVIEPSDIGNKI